jgi:hypothetical protein
MSLFVGAEVVGTGVVGGGGAGGDATVVGVSSGCVEASVPDTDAVVVVAPVVGAAGATVAWSTDVLVPGSVVVVICPMVVSASSSRRPSVAAAPSTPRARMVPTTGPASCAHRGQPR